MHQLTFPLAIITNLLLVVGSLPLAQAVDPLSGWGVLIIQGGAFGLLGYIVVVLAPRYFREVREYQEKRDAEAKGERDARLLEFSAMVDRMEQHFAERNASIVANVGRNQQLLETIARNLDALMTAGSRGRGGP